MKKAEVFTIYYKRWQHKNGNIDNSIKVLKLLNTTTLGIKRFTIDLERRIIVYQKGKTVVEKDLDEIFLKEIRISPERD